MFTSHVNLNCKTKNKNQKSKKCWERLADQAAFMERKIINSSRLLAKNLEPEMLILDFFSTDAA